MAVPTPTIQNAVPTSLSRHSTRLVPAIGRLETDPLWSAPATFGSPARAPPEHQQFSGEGDREAVPQSHAAKPEVADADAACHLPQPGNLETSPLPALPTAIRLHDACQNKLIR
ncbi:hypothetical protein HYFRA_00012353 [Hymenoscyphus fraxineus]|uniref:Uncharacterized protein n=1 Tax=Hymenoscyphus fraxineus TaxID=746836 RepID=A0A9N9L271_9HELO|nr:hypothetical protein HYFRA_00012353 [Hymenoscyphus fraxineus]